MLVLTLHYFTQTQRNLRALKCWYLHYISSHSHHVI